jgi:hypothetical protein
MISFFQCFFLFLFLFLKINQPVIRCLIAAEVRRRNAQAVLDGVHDVGAVWQDSDAGQTVRSALEHQTLNERKPAVVRVHDVAGVVQPRKIIADGHCAAHGSRHAQGNAEQNGEHVVGSATRRQMSKREKKLFSFVWASLGGVVAPSYLHLFLLSLVLSFFV